NVNSEGIYWDHAWAAGDVKTSPFGENQLRDRIPVKGEYQRYPGHPATTCLSPVFGFLPGYEVPTGDTVAAADYTGPLSKYYATVPRISGGGTKGGTVASAYAGAPAAPISVDSERL